VHSYRGASGFVQLALDKRTNEQVAIKFLERGGGASQRVIARELLNHRECALHPNIVQLKVHTIRRCLFKHAALCSEYAWFARRCCPVSPSA
jgi:serine/threonine protein kinase